VGWADIGLLYLPLGFGNNEWEFGIIAQTFDALPMSTVGMLLLALGLRARGAGRVFTRGHAIICMIVVLVLVLLLVIFSLDIPIALKAMMRVPQGASPTTQPNPILVSGIKRGIAKAVLFGLIYIVTFGGMAWQMWRKREV
jgi:hypothetical protein